MDYPSTTQALFALIVMIIVLAFILVYCCWGTFSCPQRETTEVDEETTAEGQTQGRESPNTPAFVILPYHSMIYIGDRQTQQIYQIPMREDKPPAYKDIFTNIPPSPPNYDCRPTISDPPPPSYEECVRNRDGRRESGAQRRRESGAQRLSSPTVQSLNASVHSFPCSTSQREYILSSTLKGHGSNIFRARSLVTVIPSNPSRVSSSSFGQSPRIIPTISVLSSDSHSPNSNTLSHSSLQTSFSSSCSVSNPCLTSASSSSLMS